MYMKTIDKILNILKMKKDAKSYKVKMYAEMILDDGRVIATEDEQFMIGSKVFAVGDDGSAEPLEQGEYTMENGNKMTIDQDSRILDMGEEAEAEEVEAEEHEEKEEMDKHDDIEKRLAALEDEVREMKKHKDEMSEEKTEMTETNISDEVKEEKIEMSSEDVIGELMTQVEELNAKIVELSKEPATETITLNPEGTYINDSVNFNKLSTKERAAYYINNK